MECWFYTILYKLLIWINYDYSIYIWKINPGLKQPILYKESHHDVIEVWGSSGYFIS